MAGEALIIGHVLPLTDAISDLQTNRVKALLEGGADPNVREEDATSWPPLALRDAGHGDDVRDLRRQVTTPSAE